MKMKAWWDSKPNSMYRPILKLKEKGEIEDFSTSDYRLWRRNPVTFVKECFNKRSWNWLVSIRSYDKSMFFYYLASKLGKKSVFFSGNVDWSMSRDGETPFIRYFWKRYLQNDNTTIVSVTETGSDSMVENMGVGADKIIPHSCDTETFYPRDVEEGGPDVIFVGRLVPEKNISFILEMVKNNPEIDFWICGTGELEEEVKTTEKQVENLDYKGYVNGKDKLAEYYSMAALKILPSSQIGAATENFGVVVIESLACETPVVAFDQPGPESILQDIGVVLEEGKRKEFEQEMKDLLDDKERIQTLGEKGRELVEEKYDIDKVSEKWRNLFAE